MVAAKHLSQNGKEPDIVILFKGTNDFGGNVIQSTFESEYSLMVDNVKSKYPNTKIYLSTILYRSTMPVNENGDSVEDFNERIKNVAANKDLEVIDFYNCGINESNATEYLIDGLHPNAAGQELMYQEAKKVVYDYL